MENELENHQMPPVIREILAVRNKFVRKSTFLHLVAFFQKYSDDSERTVQAIVEIFIKQLQVEGDFGHLIVLTFQKNVENPYFRALSLLPFGILLNMSVISRYKQQSVKIIKETLRHYSQQQMLQSNSAWLTVTVRKKAFQSFFLEIWYSICIFSSIFCFIFNCSNFFFEIIEFFCSCLFVFFLFLRIYEFRFTILTGF